MNRFPHDSFECIQPNQKMLVLISPVAKHFVCAVFRQIISTVFKSK